MHPRLKAALIHLLLTACVLAAVFLGLLLTWFPSPYAAMLEPDRTLAVRVAITLFGGALLVAVVWKHGKRGLVFDLVVIVLLQCLGLGWSVMALKKSRPQYAVFAVDRFNILTERDRDSLIGSAPPDAPWRGPLLVAAQVPDDPAVYDRLLTETLFEGKPDIERRPEYWTDFDTARQAAWERAKPLKELAGVPAGELETLAERLDGVASELRFLPAIGPFGDFTAILDPDTSEPVALLRIDPWGPP